VSPYLDTRDSVVSTDILAQASSSRPGENHRNSPSFSARALTQASGCVLSDELSRSGETASPKRELAKSPGVTVAVSPKRASTV